MRPERWQELKATLLDRFEVIDQGVAPIESGPGTVERLTVRTPAGTIRLEYVTKPRLIGERGRGGKRIGSSITIEREYSATERVSFLKVYRLDPSTGGWTELNPDSLP